MSRAEEAERKRKVCNRCLYHGHYNGREIYCRYIVVTGQMRPCRAVDCVEMGVFRSGVRKRVKV